MATGLGDEQLWLCPTLDNATPFNDLSSQGNNGTAVGGLTTVADTGSGGAYCYDFDGTNDYISVPSSSSLSFTDAGGDTECSFSLWAKLASYSNNANSRGIALLGKGSALGQNADCEYMLNCYDGKPSLTLYPQASNGANYLESLSTNAEVPVSTWKHITFTYSGCEVTGCIQIFVDGVLISATDSSSNYTGMFAGAGDFEIGTTLRVAFSRWLYGQLDDIRVYNRVLTQSEITHLATARGIEGRPFDGLGDEQLWLCPSLENSPNDLSGNNNNGVYQNGMGTVADTAEGGSLAYDFDGANDYIAYPIAAIDSANSIGSVSAWVNMPPTAAAIGQIIGGSDASSADTWSHLRLDSGEPTVVTNSSGQVGDKQSSTSVNDSNWHHVCAVGNGSDQSIYVDGTLVSSTWVGTPRGDRWLGYPAGMNTGSIGALVRSSLWGMFEGKMDDIRAYNRVLTQSEISWLATERGVLGTPPEGLGDEQLWLCPSIQDSPNDLSGNNNNGAYNGGMGTIADTAEGGSLAYQLNGSQSVTNSTLDLRTLKQFSFSVWFKSTSTSGNQMIFSYGETGQHSTDPALVHLRSSDLLMQFDGSTGTTASLPSINTWHHLGFVVDGENTDTSKRMQMYLDGQLVSSPSIASVLEMYNPTSFTCNLGELNGISNFGLIGLADDFRVYNRALTQAEISWLATERGVLGTPPEGLGDEQLWLCPSIQDSANDLSGNGNDGTYNGGMGTVADTSEGGSLAYDFDGTADYIRVPKANFDFLLETNSFSKSVWVRSDASSGQRTFIGGDLDSSDEGTALFQDTDGTFRGLRSKGVGAYSPDTSSSTAVPVSQWFHVAWVVDGTTSTLYMNGVQISQDTGTFVTVAGPLTDDVLVGCYSSGGGREAFLDGLIDDVRIYDRPLTQAEITHLASQRGVLGPAGSGPPASNPIALVNSTSVKGTGPTTAMDTTGANLIVISCSGWSAVPTVSDSESNTWVPLVASGGSRKQQMHYCLSPSTSLTHTFSNNGVGAPAMSVLAFSGVLDFESQVSTGDITSAATIQTGVMTPSTNGCLVIAGAVTEGGAYTAVDSGFTLETSEVYVAAQSMGNATAYLVQVAASSVNPQLTNSTVTNLSASGAVFTPSGATPPTTQYNAFVTHAFRQLFQTRLR